MGTKRFLLHQRMRKPHLGPVDGAIARPLYHAEDVSISRVEDNALEGGLLRERERSAKRTAERERRSEEERRRREDACARLPPPQPARAGRGHMASCQKRTWRVSMLDIMLCGRPPVGGGESGGGCFWPDGRSSARDCRYRGALSRLQRHRGGARAETRVSFISWESPRLLKPGLAGGRRSLLRG